MTAKQSIEVGEVAALEMKVGRAAKLSFDVKVLGVKGAYGRQLFEVTPVAGSGKAQVVKLTKKRK